MLNRSTKSKGPRDGGPLHVTSSLGLAALHAATNGDSTYSVGRFLFPTPGDDGTIVLDFNQAVLPPCAFSYAFNCPIPPPQNRLAVPIEAGEKNVLDRDGALLH